MAGKGDIQLKWALNPDGGQALLTFTVLPTTSTGKIHNRSNQSATQYLWYRSSEPLPLHPQVLTAKIYGLPDASQLRTAYRLND
jgi:hypothetical protein